MFVMNDMVVFMVILSGMVGKFCGLSGRCVCRSCSVRMVSVLRRLKVMSVYV